MCSMLKVVKGKKIVKPKAEAPIKVLEEMKLSTEESLPTIAPVLANV